MCWCLRKRGSSLLIGLTKQYRGPLREPIKVGGTGGIGDPRTRTGCPIEIHDNAVAPFPKLSMAIAKGQNTAKSGMVGCWKGPGPRIQQWVANEEAVGDGTRGLVDYHPALRWNVHITLFSIDNMFIRTVRLERVEPAIHRNTPNRRIAATSWEVVRFGISGTFKDSHGLQVRPKQPPLDAEGVGPAWPLIHQPQDPFRIRMSGERVEPVLI